MSRPVRYGAEFVLAVQEDLLHLRRTDRLEWVELLDADLIDLERLVASFPTAGKLVARRGPRELRKLRLRRTPFVVWYAAEPRSATAAVTLLRLFHVRKKSPARPRW